MSSNEKEVFIKSTATRTIIMKPRSISAKEGDTARVLPPTLYLHVSGNVEWSIFTAHGWGTGSVSTDPGGTSPYPVADLKLRIIMESPDHQDLTKEGQNTSSQDNDVKWGGTSPIFSGPHTGFIATASDPNYGTWSASCAVY